MFDWLREPIREPKTNPEFDENEYLEKRAEKHRKIQEAIRFDKYLNTLINYVPFPPETPFVSCKGCGHTSRPMDFKVGKAVMKYYQQKQGRNVWECPHCGAVWYDKV